jgi:hypothetical protein
MDTKAKLATIGVVTMIGLVGAWLGIRAVRASRERRARRSLGRRVGWALAAGTASLAARRFARRAFAPVP